MPTRMILHTLTPLSVRWLKNAMKLIESPPIRSQIKEKLLPNLLMTTMMLLLRMILHTLMTVMLLLITKSRINLVEGRRTSIELDPLVLGIRMQYLRRIAKTTLLLLMTKRLRRKKSQVLCWTWRHMIGLLWMMILLLQLLKRL